MKPTFLAGVAALTGLTGGCGIGPQVRSQLHAYDVGAGVSAVRLAVDGHHVEVTAADRSGVHVVEKVRSNRLRPSTTHQMSGGTLVLKGSDCGTSIGFNVCDVRYRLEVPRTLAVQLATNGGDVTLHGLAGPVVLNTRGGRATADGLTSKNLAIRTGGGELRLGFAAEPDLLDADSAGGHVTMSLPTGRYALDARTAGGARTVAVGADATSPHRVTVRSGGGELKLLAH